MSLIKPLATATQVWVPYRLYRTALHTISFIQYNHAIHSYKWKFWPLHLWIHHLDQLDSTLTSQLHLVILHDYVILFFVDKFYWKPAMHTFWILIIPFWGFLLAIFLLIPSWVCVCEFFLLYSVGSSDVYLTTFICFNFLCCILDICLGSTMPAKSFRTPPIITTITTYMSQRII